MRLGDLDALKKAIIEPLDVNDVCKNDWYEGYYTAKNEDVTYIDNAPTVEPDILEIEEKFWHRCGFLQGYTTRLNDKRPQGEWGKHGECPFCSYVRQWEDDKFCGNCGADMRGKEE